MYDPEMDPGAHLDSVLAEGPACPRCGGHMDTGDIASENRELIYELSR